jgi:tetratricopeptide (TPR) repeat protein
MICTRIQVGYWHDSVTLFERALSVTKNNYKMQYALGYELVSQGRVDEGIEHYHQALEIAPVIAEIRYNLANALRRQGKIDEAIEQYRLAVGYKNDYADAYNNLGYALLLQARFDEAGKSFSEAMRIKPDMIYALVGLAQVLAVKPNSDFNDISAAIELAERAATVTSNKNATVLDTLAVAYAAEGRFDDAVKAGQAALDLAIAENNKQLASVILKHLELFKGKKSYSVTSSPNAEILPKTSDK